MFQLIEDAPRDEPWNKGKLIGQKKPLKLKEIWAIRFQLQMAERRRDLALFNLAIDSKLRGCDLIKLRVSDVTHGGRVMSRAKVMQQKTQQPVQFEIADRTKVGLQCGTRPSHIRHPLDAPDESDVDLPSHEEPTGCPASAWPYQARKHGSISRSRG